MAVTAKSPKRVRASVRFGRRRLVCTAMILSIGLAAILGFVGSMSYALAVTLLRVYGQARTTALNTTP
jgi:hypothetical protein